MQDTLNRDVFNLLNAFAERANRSARSRLTYIDLPLGIFRLVSEYPNPYQQGDIPILLGGTTMLRDTHSDDIISRWSWDEVEDAHAFKETGLLLTIKQLISRHERNSGKGGATGKGSC